MMTTDSMAKTATGWLRSEECISKPYCASATYKEYSMKHSIKYLLTALSLGVTFAAHADTFYCGEKLIEEGMTQDQVIQFCGEPASRSGYNWTYDRGPEEFSVLVYFEPDGTVGNIEQQMSE
jgi:hypothetical protein